MRTPNRHKSLPCSFRIRSWRESFEPSLFVLGNTQTKPWILPGARLVFPAEIAVWRATVQQRLSEGKESRPASAGHPLPSGTRRQIQVFNRESKKRILEGRRPKTIPSRKDGLAPWFNNRRPTTEW